MREKVQKTLELMGTEERTSFLEFADKKFNVSEIKSQKPNADLQLLRALQAWDEKKLACFLILITRSLRKPKTPKIPQ